MDSFLALIRSIDNIFVDFVPQVRFSQILRNRTPYVLFSVDLLWFRVLELKAELVEGEGERFEGVVEKS